MAITIQRVILIVASFKFIKDITTITKTIVAMEPKALTS